jgi:hypothetical protein
LGGKAAITPKIGQAIIVLKIEMQKAKMMRLLHHDKSALAMTNFRIDSCPPNG